ncbi:helix-turn-helix domain-containing protein [Thermaurantiacus tibetensis]|uniref:helix-turn-helix domain-containing protein n=1 Tax=Thermaurantiacus tibetensis TaxID=2759035 RepID=UPI00188EDB56|nr:helix-turn-helix transcriptional regulator [Thermaurantiacus tibetensis]
MIDPNILRARRTQMGLSLEKLARKAALSKSQIHKIEQGKVGRPNETTVTRLAKALELTPEQLAGKAPIENGEHHTVWEPRRVSTGYRMTVQNRNALAFVARRYRVPAAHILELAPLMFHILAGLSLKARREALDEVFAMFRALDDANGKLPHLGPVASNSVELDDLLNAEDEAIRKRDLLSLDLTREDGENPFVHFLNTQLAAITAPEEREQDGVHDWDGFRTPDYTICSSDLSAFCQGDEDAIHGLSVGWIGFHDIPAELRADDRAGERLDWLKARYAEAKREADRKWAEAGLDILLEGEGQ